MAGRFTKGEIFLLATMWLYVPLKIFPSGSGSVPHLRGTKHCWGHKYHQLCDQKMALKRWQKHHFIVALGRTSAGTSSHFQQKTQKLSWPASCYQNFFFSCFLAKIYELPKDSARDSEKLHNQKIQDWVQVSSFIRDNRSTTRPLLPVIVNILILSTEIHHGKHTLYSFS